MMWKETDVAIVELQNKNCHSDTKSGAWIEIEIYDTASKIKTDSNLPGRAGHWDLHLPNRVSYLPRIVGQTLLSYPAKNNYRYGRVHKNCIILYLKKFKQLVRHTSCYYFWPVLECVF